MLQKLVIIFVCLSIANLSICTQRAEDLECKKYMYTHTGKALSLSQSMLFAAVDKIKSKKDKNFKKLQILLEDAKVSPDFGFDVDESMSLLRYANYECLKSENYAVFDEVAKYSHDTTEKGICFADRWIADIERKDVNALKQNMSEAQKYAKILDFQRYGRNVLMHGIQHRTLNAKMLTVLLQGGIRPKFYYPRDMNIGLPASSNINYTEERDLGLSRVKFPMSFVHIMFHVAKDNNDPSLLEAVMENGGTLDKTDEDFLCNIIDARKALPGQKKIAQAAPTCPKCTHSPCAHTHKAKSDLIRKSQTLGALVDIMAPHIVIWLDEKIGNSGISLALAKDSYRSVKESHA